MTQKILDTVFTKVATQDKAARVLSLMIGVNKQIKKANKQAVQTKVASIVDGVMMKKKAYVGDDILSSILWSQVPVANIPNAIGGIAGMVGDPASEEEEARYDKTPGRSFFPGVGANRAMKRHKRQLVNDKGETPHFWSQSFGPATSTLLAGLAGAGLGAGVGGGLGAALGFDGSRTRSAGIGAGMGAVTGAMTGLSTAGIAGLVAAIKAAVDRRRTKEEQKAYANSPTTKEWLIPGVGAYNSWKSLGRTIGDSKERLEADKKDKKDEDKA